MAGALRRGGREAEGGGLLNRYTGLRRIVGSNPILSANFLLLPTCREISGKLKNRAKPRRYWQATFLKSFPFSSHCGLAFQFILGASLRVRIP